MRSQRKGGLSATTQVKVLSPESTSIARGQGFHFLEASTATCVNGEDVVGVPGSESVAGKPTVHAGTWESHIVPHRSFQQAEEARRRYGDMAVGLTHSRGVGRVIPAEPWVECCRALEGVSGKTQRDAYVGAIHGDG